MKKTLYTLLALLSCYSFAFSQSSGTNIYISEIMANSPGAGPDSIEFIEITNPNSFSFGVDGYYFTQGVTFTFPAGASIPAGGTVLISNDSVAVFNAFGVMGYQWAGGLANGGEDIALVNPGGGAVDSVDYGGLGWAPPTNADNYTMELCNPSGDHNDPANWYAATNPTGVILGGMELLATPGAANTCTPPAAVTYPVYLIADIDGVDASGVADSVGVTCELRGVVHCSNFRTGTGLDFRLIESTNTGITVFSFNNISGYTVTEGDSLHISGEVAQFNGLLQMDPDSISLISQGNSLVSAMTVTALDESTENKRVHLTNMMIPDTSQWDMGVGTGFNVDITNGTDTISMRVDDATDLFNMPVPMGSFDISGFGSQYDSSSPYDGGYQLMPCGDVDLMVTSVTKIAADFEARLFPNPTSGILNVQTDNLVEMAVVTDMLGRQIAELTPQAAQFELNVADWNAGMYHITLMTENGRLTKTFVVE